MSIKCVISTKDLSLGAKATAYIKDQVAGLRKMHPHLDYAEVHLFWKSGYYGVVLRAPLPHQETINVGFKDRSLSKVLKATFNKGLRIAKRKREQQTHN